MDARAARQRGGPTAHACSPEADRTLFEGAQAGGGERTGADGTRYRQRLVRLARWTGRPGSATLSLWTTAKRHCASSVTPSRTEPAVLFLILEGSRAGRVDPPC